MSAPTVSVLMASYSHEDFVRETVASVLAQTFQDFELVVTDDGSLDATADVVAAFKDDRIRLTRFEENRDACLAANHGLRLCRGRLIAVINSDDTFVPGKLETQARFLDAHPEVAAVFAWAQRVDENGAPLAGESDQDVQKSNVRMVSRRGEPVLSRHSVRTPAPAARE